MGWGGLSGMCKRAAQEFYGLFSQRKVECGSILEHLNRHGDPLRPLRKDVIDGTGLLPKYFWSLAWLVGADEMNMTPCPKLTSTAPAFDFFLFPSEIYEDFIGIGTCARRRNKTLKYMRIDNGV